VDQPNLSQEPCLSALAPPDSPTARWRPSTSGKRANINTARAGSCGLELFNNLQLPVDAIRKVSVFAYGPVARRRPDCVHLLVGATRDSISKHYFPAPDHIVDCGHMNYLSNPIVRTLCREFIERVTRSPSDRRDLE
jgi:hypothetical protein